MAEHDNSSLGLYDWLDVAQYNRMRRACPKCGSSYIKFGVHDQAHSGFELSVTCGDCHHFEQGANSGADAERMVMGWHTAT